VCVTPDDKHALSGGAEDIVRLWEMTTGRELRQFDVKGHVRSIAIIDANRFITGDHDKIKVWDLNTGKKLLESPAQPSCVQSVAYFEKQGRGYVVFGTEEWGLRLWRMPPIP